VLGHDDRVVAAFLNERCILLTSSSVAISSLFDVQIRVGSPEQDRGASMTRGESLSAGGTRCDNSRTA
jgi:hypothetical protein